MPDDRPESPAAVIAEKLYHHGFINGAANAERAAEFLLSSPEVLVALSTTAGPSQERCPECGAATYEERTEPSSLDYCAEPSVPYPCCPDCGWQGPAVAAPSPREEAVEAVPRQELQDAIDMTIAMGMECGHSIALIAQAVTDVVLSPHSPVPLSAARPSSPTPEETNVASDAQLRRVARESSTTWEPPSVYKPTPGDDATTKEGR